MKNNRSLQSNGIFFPVVKIHVRILIGVWTSEFLKISNHSF
ncbi:hypothetical protein HMPREF0204_14335 [Chryseobacterium gleum ATCC 35910]|uniref:Uncharacterized protein n=1 Tax=Chryseobacterium gleum ATCC 35910 TaxID=525257 RepID=A0ABN0AQD8_CHRGE|nr:hypothetical protein HMPREF0204_14335 [Chryseobacterium gleum ATCC 35910]